MANEFREQSSHSAEYFGDTRDYWWNQDFIQLMARRWGFDGVRSMLDVGCGVGHWGRLLAEALPPDARVMGVDRDPNWVENATKRAAETGHGARFHYQVAGAEQLPFEDDTFDLVTCQTVLIHVRDPGAVISEMIRVTKPGGLVVAAEPNNACRPFLFDSTSFRGSIDEICAHARFQLVCERGKEALGEGHNSLGQILPGLFAERGMADVRVYMNDRTSSLIPPYTSPHERATVDEIIDFAGRDFWLWSRSDTMRYFLAGGGLESEFESSWTTAMTAAKREAAAIKDRTLTTAGGAVCYLVSGTKRRAAP